MTTKDKMTDTEPYKLETAAAVQTSEVISNTVPTRLARRHYKAMGFWLWTPAMAHPFRTLMWALEDLAKERKVDLGPRPR